MLTKIGNEILFPLRKRLSSKLRFKPYSESLQSESREALLATSPLPAELAARMEEKHLRTSLFYGWILDQLPFSARPTHGRTLDLGSKNFVYASALAHFLSHRFPTSELTGLEVDPYRVLSTLYRRGDVANYHVGLTTKAFPQVIVRYEACDWLALPRRENYDLITSFFPFLFLDLHLRWGLHRKSFHPKAYYRRAFEFSERVLFFHQGEEEAAESIRLIREEGLGHILFSQTFTENPWMKRKHPTCVLLVQSASFLPIKRKA